MLTPRNLAYVQLHMEKCECRFASHPFLISRDDFETCPSSCDFIKNIYSLEFQLTEENKSVMGFNLSFMIEKMEVFEEAMADLLRWVKEERLKVAHVTEYPLREVARAHEDIESGNTVGQLVLVTRE